MGERSRRFSHFGDVDPLNMPEVGFKRVPFKGSPEYYLGEGTCDLQ